MYPKKLFEEENIYLWSAPRLLSTLRTYALGLAPSCSVTPPPRISRVRKDLIARGLRPAVVLGGDLNSPPFGPVRYLMGEVIGPDSDLWSNVGTFKW